MDYLLRELRSRIYCSHFGVITVIGNDSVAQHVTAVDDYLLQELRSQIYCIHFGVITVYQNSG